MRGWHLELICTVATVATDNGPEVNCPPAGYCTPDHFLLGSGSAGPLRGRKVPCVSLRTAVCSTLSLLACPLAAQRDTFEGGHRVPGIISWPAIIKGDREASWTTAITSDFLPTMLEVLNVQVRAGSRYLYFSISVARLLCRVLSMNNPAVTQRPGKQSGWAMDGVSLLPLLRGEEMPPRCIGHLFNNGRDRAFR